MYIRSEYESKFEKTCVKWQILANPRCIRCISDRYFCEKKSIWATYGPTSRILRIYCGYLTDIQRISSVIPKKRDFQQHFQKHSVNSSLFQNNKLQKVEKYVSLSKIKQKNPSKYPQNIRRIYAVFTVFPSKNSTNSVFPMHFRWKCVLKWEILRIYGRYPEYLVRCRSSEEPKIEILFTYFYRKS